VQGVSHGAGLLRQNRRLGHLLRETLYPKMGKYERVGG